VTPGRVLAELQALAARLGIAVRAEPFGRGLMEGRGGLCWLDGKALVVMDEKLGVQDRIGVLAGALATFDLESASVPPAVRQRIEAEGLKTRKRKRPGRGAKKPAHPGIARARPRAPR
jgi:hypothetical protein